METIRREDFMDENQEGYLNIDLIIIRQEIWNISWIW